MDRGTALPVRVTGPERARLSERAALASVGMALTLLVAKSWAAIATDSTAMLGSLADTGLDLIASIVTLIGVRIAALPADHDHRFGHGKAEALVALGQVVLITISALGIVDPKDPRFKGDTGAAQAEARADAKRQLVEKALAMYVDPSSLNKNYGNHETKLQSQPGN